MHCRRLLAIVAFASSLAAQSPKKPVCATCHPRETAEYLQTAMGQSLGSPRPVPSGTVRDPKADAVVTVTQISGKMVHSLTEHGITAQFPAKYEIGAGLIGHTYAVQLGDSLFESPVSYFNRYGWDLSPGYAGNTAIDFDRVIDEQCLACHSSGARFTDADRHHLAAPALSAITCERCHGPSAAHVQHPSRTNIVNPLRLPHVERDSVCEQCHLEGVTRILNPGKQWSDFQPGRKAEDTFATYTLRGGSGTDVIAISQAEQLADSKCARGSGGKLWCGSCHNPHGKTNVRDVCLQCHAAMTLSPAVHAAALQDCTSCHMPTSPTTDIPHTALTDHRLRKRPSTQDADESGPLRVRVWREPRADLRDRNLALAEVFVGVEKSAPNIADDGIRLLQGLPQTGNDPAVLSDQEGLALRVNDLTTAVAIGRKTVELQPRSAKAAMNYGVVLRRYGDSTAAEHELERATRLDPALKTAFMELAMLYASEGRSVDALAAIDRYLKFNPQDIRFRLQRLRFENHE